MFKKTQFSSLNQTVVESTENIVGVEKVKKPKFQFDIVSSMIVIAAVSIVVVLGLGWIAGAFLVSKRRKVLG